MNKIYMSLFQKRSISSLRASKSKKHFIAKDEHKIVIANYSAIILIGGMMKQSIFFHVH
jgi:hypothetical protein